MVATPEDALDLITTPLGEIIMTDEQGRYVAVSEHIRNMPGWKQAEIRRLNNELRVHGRGGMVLVTNGIAGLDPSAINQILAAVASFDSFNPDNDPHGEHDCAILKVAGIEVLWKIDYYDRSRRFHSPDAADPKVTVRVLTVMRADEY